MFNLKRIKELEEELALVKRELEIEERYRDTIISQMKSLNTTLINIQHKIDPKPVTHYNYDVSAIALAKKLQRNPKKQQCGGGRACQMYYQIPCSEIDNIAKLEPKPTT